MGFNPRSRMGSDGRHFYGLYSGKKITPEKLLPFPWDKKKKAAAAKKAKEYTPEQQRRRMEELVKKLGDSLQ